MLDFDPDPDLENLCLSLIYVIDDPKSLRTVSSS